MSNDGSGCVWGILLSLLLVVVVGVAVSMTGLPTWDAGTLNWNTDATYERQLTERERIAAENETEQQRISADERTSTEWAITLRWLGVAAAAGVGVWAWSRRPHKPVPQQVIALLPSFPGHVAEFSSVEREWTIVEPTTGEYYTATDARRLLEMRNEF